MRQTPDIKSTAHARKGAISTSPPNGEIANNGKSSPPGRRLALSTILPARAALLECFAETIAYARAMDMEPDPKRAVHEFRKTIRRLRSAAKLIRGSIDRRERRGLDDALRAIVDDTTAARDAAVVLGTLDGLELPEELAAARERARATLAPEVEERLAAQAGGPSWAEKSAELEPLPELLGRALPEDFEWEAIDEGLRASHRRAWNAMRRAQKTRKPRAIHRWRKRTKELRYELEMLLPFNDPAVVEEHQNLDKLAHALGTITDLMVLRRALKETGRRLEEDEFRPLRKHVRCLVEERLDEALESASFLRKKPASDLAFLDGLASR